MELKKKKSISRLSQAIEEWCKCGKCGTMLTKKECRFCHEAALSLDALSEVYQRTLLI